MESHGKAIYSDTIEIPDIQQEEPLLSNEDTLPVVYQPSRFHRFNQQFTKRNVKKQVYAWRWVILFLISTVIMGCIMWRYRVQVFQGLETLSLRLKDMGFKGYILMSALIFSSAFPPIIGYGTYQTLSGFTFGFKKGFPISYFSALTGAIICFSLSRRFLKARVTRMLHKYPNLEAVVKAVEKKGFKLFILIRLSPYPFNLLNVLFASTDISLFHFAAGTAITLLKIALHVYIGANLTSFAKHILGEDEDMTEGQIRAEKLQNFIVVIGSVVTFAGMAYIYRVAKAAVKEANETHDNEEMVGFLDESQHEEHQEHEEHELEPRQSVSLDVWDAWGDDDDEDEDDEEEETTPKKVEALGKND